MRPLLEAGAELIVADSGSRDGTTEICRDFGAVVIQVPPGNLYQAVNEALRGAKQEWLTYLNGDDLIYSDVVKAALQEFGAAADVIYGCIDYIDFLGRFLGSWTSPPPREFVSLAAAGIMPIPQQGTMFRRRVFEKLNGFDLRYRYSGDFDFFLRAKLQGFTFIRRSIPRIAAFRLHSGQISQKREAEMIAECVDFRRRNVLPTRRVASIVAFSLFRARNWDTYVVRLLRTRQLQGTLRWNRTMTPAE